MGFLFFKITLVVDREYSVVLGPFHGTTLWSRIVYPLMLLLQHGHVLAKKISLALYALRHFRN